MIPLLATLLFTLPAHEAIRVESSDSLYSDCQNGPTLVDIDSVRLYMHPVTGGGYRPIRSKSVQGRAGQPDSFDVDPGVGGHYYVTTVDLAGNESCASNQIYIPGSVVTAVGGSEPARDAVVACGYVDVRGRAVAIPKAAGVYWKVCWSRSGTLVRKDRLVILK